VRKMGNQNELHAVPILPENKRPASLLLMTAVLGCMLSVVPFAKAASVDRVDIVDKGVFEIRPGEVTDVRDAPGGKVTAAAGETLVESTDQFRGRLGLEFGFRYVLLGFPEGEAVQLDLVITFPPPGISDPAQGAPIFQVRVSREKRIGGTHYFGYGFEHDWEIVPGVWTLTIERGGTKLAEESFMVTGP